MGFIILKLRKLQYVQSCFVELLEIKSFLKRGNIKFFLQRGQYRIYLMALAQNKKDIISVQRIIRQYQLAVARINLF